MRLAVVIAAVVGLVLLLRRRDARWQPWPAPERVTMADFGVAAGWRDLERVDSV